MAPRQVCAPALLPSQRVVAPLLAVTPIKESQEGIRLVNESDYGLTSGLQSLDENEQALWKAQLKAGNLYINRGITGAYCPSSAFRRHEAFIGGGIKAGGPNYCSCFVKFSDKPEVKLRTKKVTNKLTNRNFPGPAM